MKIIILILLFSSTSAWGQSEPIDILRTTHYVTPTKKIALKDYPFFSDDIEFAWFELAINRQLKRYSEIDLSGTIKLGNKKYPLSLARASLIKMKEIVQLSLSCISLSKNDMENKKCYEDFNSKVKFNFNVFAPDLVKGDPRENETKSTFFTGYYTPSIEGRKEPDERFKYAIYKKPKDKILARSTREQIDFDNALTGHNLELFYIESLFDLYLIHVEGGGKIILNDPLNSGYQYLSYDGTNNQKWQWISKYMKDQGWIKDSSIASQKKYIEDHPKKLREIFSTCPSYIFFKPTPTPPNGSDQVPLTDRRSLATDRKLYGFKGLLSFVSTRRPSEDISLFQKSKLQPLLDYVYFSRFYLDQDVGGAIKGKARADLYFGEGDYARLGASNMTKRGVLSKTRF